MISASWLCVMAPKTVTRPPNSLVSLKQSDDVRLKVLRSRFDFAGKGCFVFIQVIARPIKPTPVIDPKWVTVEGYPSLK